MLMDTEQTKNQLHPLNQDESKMDNDNGFEMSNNKLVKLLENRSSVDDLVERRVLIGGPNDDYNEVMKKNKMHKRKISQKMDEFFGTRVDKQNLVDRGIILDPFSQKMEQLKTLINSLNFADLERQRLFLLLKELENDHNNQNSNLQQKLIDKDNIINQFQADYKKLEQKMRTETENKQRVILHMRGVIQERQQQEQQLRNEYDSKINELRNEFEMKYNEINNNNSNSNNNNNNENITSYIDFISENIDDMKLFNEIRKRTIDLVNNSNNNNNNNTIQLLTQQNDKKLKQSKKEIQKLKRQTKKKKLKMIKYI